MPDTSKAVAAVQEAGKAWATKDSFQNFGARIGIGADNLLSGSTWATNYTSRNRWLLENIYRSSWIAGRVVDQPAVDMVREGATPRGSIQPEDIERLTREASSLRLWHQLGSVLKWSRLYGGSVGFLMIDGQDPATPLNPDRVGKGEFKGVLPLDRWMLQPMFSTVVTEYGPDWGKPMFYDTVQDTFAMKAMHIHYSRVIRFEGVELPYWQRLAENLWGQSVIERLIDRLMCFDSATLGAGQLVYKAHQRTVKIKGLRQILAAGGKAYQALTDQLDLIRKMQSFEGMAVLDGEDEYQTDNYTFSGLDSVLIQLGEQIAGATEIPLTILFGQTPAGLNAGEEGPIRTYYDGIKQRQKDELQSPVHRVWDLLYRSTLGKAPPDDFNMEFNPLWQLAADKRGELGAQITTAITGAFDSGVIDRCTALRELRQASDLTGLWTNITENMIEEAEDEPPPGTETLGAIDPDTGLPVQEPPQSAGGAGAAEPGKSTTNVQDPAAK